MTRLSVSQARLALPDTINRVSYGGERIIISRNGRDAAALVSLGDLRLLEEMEDRLDAEEAKRRLAGEKPVPYKKARKEMGLSR